MLVDAVGGANFYMQPGERASIWLALDNETIKGPTTSFAHVGATVSGPADLSASAAASFVITDDNTHTLWLFSSSKHAEVPGNNGWISLKLL